MVASCGLTMLSLFLTATVLEAVQLEGKTPQPIREFLLGNPDLIGTLFE